MSEENSEKKQEQKEDSKASSRISKPFVFISHDTKDASLADEFSKLLSNVSMGLLKSFRSSDKKGKQGIAYGLEWYQEIMKKLDEASDVVCLLTANSINRPWILYEAGVARGKLETPVLGIALGIPLNKANNGPFAQFQNCGDSTDELTKLVVQLSERIPGADPPTDIIRNQVEEFKKKSEEILNSQPELENFEGMIMEDTSVAKLFEEIKIMFQDLPSRIERNIDPVSRKRRFRLHPKMIDEIMFTGEKLGDKYIGFLIMISIFKDEMPWVYEIGIDTFHILKSQKSTSVKEKAMLDFRRIIKYSTHHPFMMEMYGSKDFMMYFEESLYMMDKLMSRFIEK